MKLLFDANLSPKLVGRWAGLFDSVRVFDTGLARLQVLQRFTFGKRTRRFKNEGAKL